VRRFSPLTSFAFLGLLGGTFVASAAPDAPARKPLAGRIIVIDPGHAVLDESGKLINPGAKARGGVWERDAVLAVAEKLTPILEAQGAKVFQTRTAGNPWRYSGQADTPTTAHERFLPTRCTQTCTSDCIAIGTGAENLKATRCITTVGVAAVWQRLCGMRLLKRSPAITTTAYIDERLSA
jgi:hypothetical protein